MGIGPLVIRVTAGWLAWALCCHACPEHVTFLALSGLFLAVISSVVGLVAANNLLSRCRLIDRCSAAGGGAILIGMVLLLICTHDTLNPWVQPMFYVALGWLFPGIFLFLPGTMPRSNEI